MKSRLVAKYLTFLHYNMLIFFRKNRGNDFCDYTSTEKQIGLASRFSQWLESPEPSGHLDPSIRVQKVQKSSKIEIGLKYMYAMLDN